MSPVYTSSLLQGYVRFVYILVKWCPLGVYTEISGCTSVNKAVSMVVCSTYGCASRFPSVCHTVVLSSFSVDSPNILDYVNVNKVSLLCLMYVDTKCIL